MQGHAYTAAAVRPQGHASESRPASPRGALAICALCVVAMALVWSVAELVPAVQVKDAALLDRFVHVNQGSVEWLAGHLVHLLDPGLFILWGVALVALALARERPRTAVAITAMMTLATVFRGEAQAAAGTPARGRRHGLHRTGVVAERPLHRGTRARAERRARRARAPASRLSRCSRSCSPLRSAVSLLIRAWHMPSDVLGGYLLATFWAALAVAGLRAAEHRWPARRRAASS